MTVQDLLRERLHTAEVADRRVEALRLAATVGRAREFHESEVQRAIDRYTKLVTSTESDEPFPIGENGNQVGTAQAGNGSGPGVGRSGGTVGESPVNQGIQQAG
jgi:hypothetical protein